LQKGKHIAIGTKQKQDRCEQNKCPPSTKVIIGIDWLLPAATKTEKESCRQVLKISVQEQRRGFKYGTVAVCWIIAHIIQCIIPTLTDNSEVYDNLKHKNQHNVTHSSCEIKY